MTNKSDGINYSFWVPGICLGSIFLYLYKDVFTALIRTWTNVPAYSHGFFVPLVSLYIIWEFRHKIANLKISPNIFVGFFVVLFACLLLVFGKASMVNIVQQGSMLVLICGLIFLLLGDHFMKVLLVPVGYLILMFPFIDGLLRHIQWPFQLLSANMAVAILKSMGIPVFLDENYMELPGITLEVARACSGIQYMVSIVAIVIPLMFIFLKDKWARVLLFLISIIVGITVNWLRVVLVALWVYRGGETLHGPGHVFQGLFVSVVGFLVLFGVAWALGKLTSSPRVINKAGAPPISKVTVDKFEEKKVRLAWIIALSVLAGTAGYGYLFSVGPVPLAKGFSGFPTSIAGWQNYENGREVKPLFNVRQADVVLNRVYRDADGEKATLYIGYFESQHQGKEIVHSDLQRLYDNSDVVQVDIGHGEVLSANKAIVEENGNRYMAMYWYNINNRYVGNNVYAKIYTAIDSLIFKKSNGAFIGVSIEMEDEDAQYKYTEHLVDFLQEVFPFVRRSLSENL